ncbi:Bax inhibitor-1/YccA family protein [Aeoliella sp. SH292]|uniref:Bax inhibitor-1/YccA family protein n=1 Tax=Aeoliella sp. SH292 TaxID=3454464 RepID=UPI003F99D4B9
MSQADFQASNPYASFGYIAADAPAVERAAFIKRTYLHLALAVYALVTLEFIYFKVVPEEWIGNVLSIPYSWAIMMGGFMLVSWVAESWARNEASLSKQYMGLGLYVFAQSILLLPLLWFASTMTTDTPFGDYNPITVAAVATIATFGLLTAVVFATSADFSFMRSILMMVGIGATILVFASVFMGFNLGVWFSGAMIVFAACYILYDTSNVMHHYRTTQHVAASLALFASVALLFWYILRLVMAFSNRD